MPSTKPSTRPRCRAADQLGMRLGQLAERAVGEGHEGVVTVVDARDGRVEPERVELAHQCLQARSRLGWRRGVGPALLAPDLGGVVAGRAGRRRQAQEHAGQERERRRLEPERRGVGRQRVAVLRPARRPSGPRWRRRAGRRRACARGGAAPCSGAGRATRRCRPWRAGRASGPARGRWRTGCCRPAPSGQVEARHPATSNARPARSSPLVYTASAGRMAGVTGLPSVDDIFAAPAGRDRSRARRQHRRPRHGARRSPSAPTATCASRREAHHRRLPAAGADPARTSGPGSPSPGRARASRIDWGEMTPDERSDVMVKARWHAARAGPRHGDPRHHPGARHRVGQGRRRQELGHRQPGGRARAAGVHRRRARRRHLGLLRPPHARRAGPPRRHEGRGRSRPHHAEREARSAPAC